MTDQAAAWGIPAWLPPRVQRSIAEAELAAAHETRLREAEAEQRREESHSRAMALYREEAEARGEVVDVIALARGEVRGRTVQDVFAEALAAADRQDVADAKRAHRDGHGDPEPLHVEFGEPVIHQPAARSETAWAIWRRNRRWQELQARRKAADDARRALEAEFDHGIINGVTRPVSFR